MWFSRCFNFSILKKQCIWFCSCCHCTFNKQWVDFHFISLLFHEAMYVVFHMFYFSLSKNSGCSFPCFIITHLIRMGWISKSHYCYFGKHCLWFFKLCHSSLSNSSKCNFPCVATTHLISSGWIFIFCHSYFTNQLMWFSTFCHCCFCYHCTFHKQWFRFSTCCNCFLNSFLTYVQ